MLLIDAIISYEILKFFFLVYLNTSGFQKGKRLQMKQLQSSNYEYITLHDDNCKSFKFFKNIPNICKNYF